MSPPTAKRIMAMSSNSCHVTVRLTSEVMSRVSYEDVARRFVRVPSKVWRKWRRRDMPNSQQTQATGGLVRWRTYVSLQGDRATVRHIENGNVYFSYIGPSGVWGLYPADTSGRSNMSLAAFVAAFPISAEEP